MNEPRTSNASQTDTATTSTAGETPVPIQRSSAQFGACWTTVNTTSNRMLRLMSEVAGVDGKCITLASVADGNG